MNTKIPPLRVGRDLMSVGVKPTDYRGYDSLEFYTPGNVKVHPAFFSWMIIIFLQY